jgi:hypothetical protein
MGSVLLVSSICDCTKSTSERGSFLEPGSTFKRIPAISAEGKTAEGWCFSDWTRWNETQYPSGESVHDPKGWAARMRALQISSTQMPMDFSYYIYFLCHDNAWCNGVPSFGSMQPDSNRDGPKISWTSGCGGRANR